MNIQEAESLAERTLAAIDYRPAGDPVGRHHFADRERVASNLAGLRRCYRCLDVHGAGFLVANDLLPLFIADLRRTAELYGVTP